MKTFVIGDLNYASFLTDIEIVDSITSAQVVIFCGGEDITPSFYKEKKQKTTINNYQRDLRERQLFRELRPDQFAIGIGRGAQFLSVMNGSKLIQNIADHQLDSTHLIIFNDQLILEITSQHHQCVDYKTIPDYCDLIALRNEINGEPRIPMIVPEVLYYHKDGNPRCFCIQGHPEIMPDSQVSKYLNNMIHSLW